MIEINLLPGAKKRTRRGGGRRIKMPAFLTGLAGGGDVLKDKWLLGAVTSGVLAAAALGWLYTSQAREAAALEERQTQAVADSTRYAAVLRERVRAEATRDTVLRQLSIIRAIDDDRFIWPHIMDEISRALPQFTWLQNVTYSGTAQGSRNASIVGAVTDTAKKDTTAKAAAIPEVARDTVRLRIQGQTVDLQAMTRFMRDLEQSPFLDRVNLEKSELVLLQDGKEIMQFSIDAYYSRPDSTVIRRVPLTLSVR